MGAASLPVSAAADIPVQRGREWQRFEPLTQLSRFAFYLATMVAVVVSLRTIDVIPEFLYDAPDQMVDLVSRMWPPDVSYARPTLNALVETIHIATLGTLIAILLAAPIGLLAARNITPNLGLNLFAKFVFVTSRSVNSLIWALLFVAIFGPGPLAGTLAIAFRSIGFTGKLFAEAIEEAQPGPIEALTSAGAPRLSALLLGYWPQVKPSFWSIALFRWDINIRESAVLGLVGAGGIGVALDTALNLLYWDQVAVVLIAIFTVVILAEIIVTTVRSRII
jgi:phosphonate transport system permease protein